jgi:hypothetical protein
MLFTELNNGEDSPVSLDLREQTLWKTDQFLFATINFSSYPSFLGDIAVSSSSA